VSEEPRPAADATPQVFIPRNVQLVLLGAALLLLWVAVRAARSVVLLFIIAGLIALLLNPLVSFLQRRRVPRPLAIPLTYVLLLVLFAAIGFALSSPISNEVQSFQHRVPHLVDQANRSLASLQRFFNRKGIHVTVQSQGQTALQTLQQKVLKGSSSLVSFSGSLLKSVANAAISIVLIFVLSVYMLIYGERIGTMVRRVLPPAADPLDDFPLRAQRAVSGYLRGQAAFSLIMGTTAGIALYVFGVLGIFPDGKTYAFAFGAFYGVMELVPFIGPILGAIPPILIALLNDPLSALWVALLFLGLQQIEGHIVAPQIFGHALALNPLLVIFALLFGNAVYGIVGALVALPLTAVLRETVLYLRRHVALESWRM
jgi:predicted PurR-regulated permease PerM